MHSIEFERGKARRPRRHLPTICGAITAISIFCVPTAGSRLFAQPPGVRVGEVVPRDVRELYDRGLNFLATTQREDGGWPNSMQDGAGTVGMGLMVFLASGEDPNFGLYSVHVRRSLRYIISAQDPETGFLGQSMYHHGFGMLALAEAYGAVDDRNLWPQGKNVRTIGAALELAVRAAITSQKNNSQGAWRYSPDSTDADTSVSGAVLVGLLAARQCRHRNPRPVNRQGDFVLSTDDVLLRAGRVCRPGWVRRIARAGLDRHAGLLCGEAERPGGIQGHARLLERSRRRSRPTRGAATKTTLATTRPRPCSRETSSPGTSGTSCSSRKLKQAQQRDGSIEGQFGVSTSTSLSLLAVAVNFRFLPIYER